jgi:iron complex outermembrane receptor protein
MLALALAAAFPVLGQTDPRTADVELAQLTELSLEQLLDVEVTSASKRAQRASDAPASITVLTAEDFKTYGWRTLADALKSVRGFYASYDRAYAFLGLRGFQRPADYNSRVLLLVDGLRVNDNVYDAAAVGTEFVMDADLIDRIEIVRGPSSSVYGGNAFFGVINVITKSGAAIGGAELGATATSFDGRGLRATYGNRLSNGASLLVSGSGYRNAGDDSLAFPDDPATAGANVADTDEENRQRFFAKYQDGGLRISTIYANREKGVTGGLYDSLIDPRAVTEDTWWFVDTAYTRQLAHVEVSGRIAYADYAYDGDYVYDDGFGNAVPQYDIAEGRWWIAELKGVTSVGQHKLVFGVEYQANTQQDQRNFDVSAPGSPYLDDRRRSNRAGLFLQDDYAILENLTISAGIRYDGYSSSDAEVNPRLAAIWRQSATTVWKLIYGTAFRPASAFEQYYSYPGSQSQAEPLHSENITTYELVLETLPADNFKLVAAAFQYKIDDLINFGTDPVDSTLTQFQNLSGAEAKGVELEGELSVAAGARVRASYSYQRAEDDQGAKLTNSPSHLAKLNLSAPVWTNVRAGWETQFQSRRKTELAELGSHAVSNLTLSTDKPWQGWNLSASVYNLFDRHYFDPADISLESGRELMPQDGRNFRLKATYRF